jgi:hypothetical protein
MSDWIPTAGDPGYNQWLQNQKNTVVQPQYTIPVATPAPTTVVAPAPAPTATVAPVSPPTIGVDTKVVPGMANPNDLGQINITDYASQVVTDPTKFFTLDNPSTNENESMFLSQRNSAMDPNTVGTNIDQQPQMDYAGAAAAVAQGNTQTAANIDPRVAATYNAAQTQQNVVNQGQMDAAQGQVSQQGQIDPADVVIDMDATGDGSTPAGAALQQFATQGMKDVVNTSTLAGKVQADALGEFNYIDSKATTKGQLEQLQTDFFKPDGTPQIPNYAQGIARNVSKIATFKGMTGTAAASAMSQALMEASISVAEQDAKFFQTVTLQNLNNKQEATLNRANVLSKMELANMDSRMAAAVQNSKAFIEMDLANLNNEQQSRVLNTQARVQSILEDAKSENAARLFGAESENDFAKFYDTMNDSINRFNVDQTNGMEKFNVDQANGMNKFNSDLENNREQFYRSMQYNIDLANAKWRQTVTMTEDQQSFEAAATDVKNMVGVSVEQLNQIWDRSDSLLDYLWKTSDSKLQRDNQLVLTKLAGDNALAVESARAQVEDNKASGALVGTVLDSFLGSTGGQSILSGVGGAISKFLF